MKNQDETMKSIISQMKENLGDIIGKIFSINSTNKEEIFDGLQNKIIPCVKEEGKKAIREIKDNCKDSFNELLDVLKSKPEPLLNVIYKETELLTKSKLIEFAKEFIVNGANEVYVWKISRGNTITINFSYGKDRNLIENCKNKFVIIKAQSLASDVLIFFEDSELVILQ